MIDIPLNASNLTKKQKLLINDEIQGLNLDPACLPLGAKLYLLRNNLRAIPLCKSCNKELSYHVPSCSYRTYCSSKCSAISSDTQNKKRTTNIEKYGTSNVLTKKAEVARLKAFEEAYEQFTRFDSKILPLFSKEVFIGKTATQAYSWRCVRCNNDFERKFIPSLHKWPRCPACDSQYTDIEELVQKFLQKHNIGFRAHYRKILPNLELDFFLHEQQIAIETNGLYFHTDRYFPSRNYHRNKTNLCNEKNIRLFQIFSDEIENFKACFGRLKSLLGLNRKIAARNCDIKLITSSQATKFFNKYHTQGAGKSAIRYGLFYKNRLVSAISFCKLRGILGQNHQQGVWELARFAGMYGVSVTGGFQKLLTSFIRDNNPIKIVTYADVRWTPDPLRSVYNTAGFNFIHTSAPNYWYTNDHLKRLHRANFQKHKLIKQYPQYSHMTEIEIMKELGYSRIWDCGNHKFELDCIRNADIIKSHEQEKKNP